MFTSKDKPNAEKLKLHWNEIWREVPPFPEGPLQFRYAVSSYGRVVSYTDNIEEGSLLKGSTQGGYKVIKLKPGGKNRALYVHRVVAEYFVEKNSPDQKYVIHIDFDKKNNQYHNLQWATKEEMEAHQRKNPEFMAMLERRRNPEKGLKLTATQVKFIKKKINDPNRKTRLKMIAKRFGISEMQLYRIKKGENWGNVQADQE